MRKCWNRQTGTFEVRVSMTCGFKSHLPHQENPRNQADFGGFSWFLLSDRTFDLYYARNQADFGHFAAYGAFSAPAQRQTGASGPQSGASVRFMGQKTAYDRRCGKPQGLAPLQKPVADRKESTEKERAHEPRRSHGPDRMSYSRGAEAAHRADKRPAT